MEIIDEEPKKELPKLKVGDVIRAEYDEQSHYFMIVRMLDDDLDCYSTVNLSSGVLSSDGEFTQTTDDGPYLSIDNIIKNFKNRGFTDIEKVELEARVKHGH